LYACACARLIPEFAADGLALKAIADAERCANGLIRREQLQVQGQWQGSFRARLSEGANRALQWVLALPHGWAPWNAASQVAAVVRQGDFQASVAPRPAGRRAERRAAGRARKARKLDLCHLLREVFGNPFRSRTLDPVVLAWKGGMVVALARTINEEGHLGDVPILGDMLEEAGCADAEVLAHCRHRGAHSLGCWAVDLILNQS
jgi:hypothetical protein